MRANARVGSALLPLGPSAASALGRAVGFLLALAIGLGAASTAEAQFTFYRDDHVRNRPAHIGVSAIGGGQIHTHDGTSDGFMRFGLDVIGTLVPGFALGFTRLGIGIGYSDPEGVIFSAGATPTMELSFFASSDTQLWLQLGCTVWLGAPTKTRPFSTDAAVTTVVGIRFWIGNTLTFGILFGNDIGVTNPGVRAWFGGPLGQAELSFFGGLELGWNL